WAARSPGASSATTRAAGEELEMTATITTEAIAARLRDAARLGLSREDHAALAAGDPFDVPDERRAWCDPMNTVSVDLPAPGTADGVKCTDLGRVDGLFDELTAAMNEAGS